jgi:putative DNA primase/helicase
VLIVEGEKAAKAAQGYFPDHVVTTSPGGANAADQADWSPLAGREVTIWPDHDHPGQNYARHVMRLAHAAGALTVHLVHVPHTWPERWDLVDALPESASPDRRSS